MSKNPRVLPRWSHRCVASVLLLLTVCSQVPPTSSVMVPAIPAGGARIWVYRTSGPHDSQDRPYLRLNGQVAGISEPNGAFYRDLPPGRYTVFVDSYGVPYPNQFAQFDLGGGQQAFIKVLSMRERVGGSDSISSRALFFTQLVPAEGAQAAIAVTPFYGAG